MHHRNRLLEHSLPSDPQSHTVWHTELSNASKSGSLTKGSEFIIERIWVNAGWRQKGSWKDHRRLQWLSAWREIHLIKLLDDTQRKRHSKYVMEKRKGNVYRWKGSLGSINHDCSAENGFQQNIVQGIQRAAPTDSGSLSDSGPQAKLEKRAPESLKWCRKARLAAAE